ncbi:MAG: hypothetical protein BWY23_02125 [Spirochaetes bacterium ADurb.Bin218]|jgi:hypothetical protein|nr:hypothetical protein [Spirochaetota bacterium]OQA96196.1 MAG: hypothetical protein BWY23_02125 [Spirochaetes bacterium ADurb.Bin218]HPX92545.1 hypothetical protein [Spirochaetota bacterium]
MFINHTLPSSKYKSTMLCAIVVVALSGLSKGFEKGNEGLYIEKLLIKRKKNNE